MFTVTTYVLPDRLRTAVRRPLGELVSGSPVNLAKVLREATKKEKPTKLILVGDTVSREASQAGILADVMIIDNFEKRQSAIVYAYPKNRMIRAKNQAGKIEEKARVAVERAIRGEASVVEIDGEEDLLALTAVLDAPSGSLVVYGQPNKGVVLVKVSDKTKAEAKRILEQMERVG